jgi:hypothetical protein
MALKCYETSQENACRCGDLFFLEERLVPSVCEKIMPHDKEPKAWRVGTTRSRLHFDG